MHDEATTLRTDTILPIDKAKGWTSFDVVHKIRNLLGIKKVGHAGTLDPLATGLLLLGIGRGTKAIATYQAMQKRYTGTFLLGKTTPSYDLETPYQNEQPYDHLEVSALHDAANAMRGEQWQAPPIYSACKVDGVRAYRRARKGKAVTIPPRQIVVHDFTLTHVELPYVHFAITCSKGTYIRSIAHDFGKLLGVGGCLFALRRTHIGPFDVEKAYTIDFLEQQKRAGRLQLSDAASTTSS